MLSVWLCLCYRDNNMVFETYQNIAKQKIDTLRDADLDPIVLDQVNAFITSPDIRPAAKVVQSYDDLQLWWSAENEETVDFEHLCMTFALKGLTISLEHRHFPTLSLDTENDNETIDIVPLSEETGFDTYTLHLEKKRFASNASIQTVDNELKKVTRIQRHTPSLYKGNRLRASSPLPLRDEEALEAFMPRLDHTFRVLGYKATELAQYSDIAVELAS